MTNPYNQPSEYVSTTTNWFNPNGVAHYARPVPQLDIYQATNNTLNRIIAGNPTRVAAVDALFEEKRVRDEARRREVAEAAATAKAAEEKRAQKFAAAIEQQKEEEFAAIDRNRRAKYKAEMNPEAEEEAAADRQIQELRRWRDYCFQRYVNGHEQTAAEKQEEKEHKERLHLKKWDLQRNARMDSKAAFDAWLSVNEPRHAQSQSRNAGGRQAPLSPSSPAPEPEACCDFDHCYGFCENIETP